MAPEEIPGGKQIKLKTVYFDTLQVVKAGLGGPGAVWKLSFYFHIYNLNSLWTMSSLRLETRNFSHYFDQRKGDAKLLFIFLKILDLNNIMSIWCLFYTQQPNPAHYFNLKQINLGNF